MKRIRFLVLLISVLSCTSQDHRLPKVDQINLEKRDLQDFERDEWFVPYYLNNIEKVVNSVVDTGQNRGFIDIVVWRTSDVNKPYNARIMENILSMAWFYTTDRPWNQYFGDPALRKRLEAALTFWCDMQSPEGKFSEYDYQRWSLAPTAFATKFIGRAIYLLETGPPLDEAIMNRAVEALRKALFISFTDNAFWLHGRNFTNQYANLWGGALMYLQHHKDPAIDQLLTNRINDSMNEFQSPCGYFYEKNGPDWGYNLNTHHSDLQVAWHFAKGTRLEPYFIEKTQRWYDWLAMNAVKEPHSSRYYLNKAIETRQQKGYLDTDILEDPSAMRWTPQAEFVPSAHAFVLCQEEYDSLEKIEFDNMSLQFPRTREMKAGEFWSFSPYAFLHHGLERWLPSRQQKWRSINSLPYMKNSRFTEVRKDTRNSTDYSFVRRPSYYAIFNSGRILTDQQRYGLGLIWNPSMGAVMQSQSKSDFAAWGTMAADSSRVFEAYDVNATFLVDDVSWRPAPGANQITASFAVQYPLGETGRKLILFNEETIDVEVTMQGIFKEVVPLLIGDDDDFSVDDKRVSLRSKRRTMIIELLSQAEVHVPKDVVDTDGGKTCRVVEIRGEGNLKYRLCFVGSDPI